MKYDVIVVGAGPAGLMAARELEGKAKYLIIEANKKIGYPLRCGEGVRCREFCQLFGSDLPFVVNRVSYQEVRHGDYSRAVSLSYLELDKPRFEQWLSAPLTSISLSTRCEDVIIRNDCAEVITNRGTFKAGMVVLAYGCNYAVQRRYGLVKGRPRMITGYGGIYRGRHRTLKHDRFYYYFDDDYLGYLWVFPKGEDTFNIGFGAYNAVSAREAFSSLTRKHGFDRLERIGSYSGVVPCSGPIDRTYHDRLIVCGNAAGQVFAGTGEGTYYALRIGKIAGEIAVRAARNKSYSADALSRYEDKWKSMFEEALCGGVAFGELFALGYKYGQYHKLFSTPSNMELTNMIQYGKMPFRTKAARLAARLLVDSQNVMNKEPVPQTVRLIYRVARAFG
ncbi:MAG: NAD(P)/FAD-dependent oxidoreductase [archaeon]